MIKASQPGTMEPDKMFRDFEEPRVWAMFAAAVIAGRDSRIQEAFAAMCADEMLAEWRKRLPAKGDR
jgi:hypothetical protein